MNSKTALGFLLLLGVPAMAGSQAVPQVTVPGERGFVLKLTNELIGLAVTRDHDARVDLFLKSGDERLKELERMRQEGQTSHHDALGSSYSGLVTDGACGVIESGAAKGKDMTAAVGRCASATDKHVQVLEGVLDRVPPQAQEAILHAIEVSRHGHERASEAHERGKGKGAKGRPSDKPEDRGGPPPGKGKVVDEGGDPGKGKPPKGPPPGKGKPLDDARGKPESEGEPGKGNGPKGPPPGKGKDK